MKTIQGTGVALITPFDAAGQVDFVALERLVNRVIAGGVDYLVALGTTAETPTLSLDEKHRILDCIRSTNAARVPIVLGIGGNSTHEVAESFARFDLKDVEAILSVTPYYNKPTQNGLYEHYRARAIEAPRPIILYNVPGRTGVNLAAETTLRLAHGVRNILGVKEASGSLSQMAYILRDRPEGFLVISGDDGLAMPLGAMGGDGLISVAANAFPEQVSKMVGAAAKGDVETASKLHLRLIEPIDALFAEGNPAGVKAALYMKEMIHNAVRLPLVPASAGLVERLRGLMEQYDL